MTEYLVQLLNNQAVLDTIYLKVKSYCDLLEQLALLLEDHCDYNRVRIYSIVKDITNVDK